MRTNLVFIFVLYIISIIMLTVMFVNIVNYYSDMTDWKGTNPRGLL